ncbi:immunoglobulin-like domain-containing protein [Bifidobacterium reuteri]|nr:immunoglobulin-like domain-containing protein [Bifidobacterium reuteri]
MKGRDSVMRGGVKPLWLRLVGVLAALAMLLTGMVATATADAADNASGDVKLVWGRDMFYVKDAIRGVRDGDAWTPDLDTTGDSDYADTLDYGRDFYGWNTKADGTGDWYRFRRNFGRDSSTFNKVVVEQAPKLANGKVKYPEGGVLYAQWQRQTSGQYDKVQLQQTKVRKSDFKNLTITSTGWSGTFRGGLYIAACGEPAKDNTYDQSCMGPDGTMAGEGPFGNNWYANYYNRFYVDANGDSEPFSLGSGTLDDADLSKFVDAAYANSEVKYFTVYVFFLNWDTSPIKIGDIALDRSVAPAPDTVAPVFAGVSDVTVDQGVVFDPLAGVTARDDRDGDVTSAVTVSPSAVDTSEPGETTLTYTVKDKAGNTATVSRVVRVKSVAPDADRDLTGDTRDDGLIGLGAVAPGAKVTLRLPAGYAGRTGDVYVYSTPTVLAVGATVSDEGTLGVALPAGLPAGVHRIVFKPYDASLPLVWDSFEVKAAQEKPAPSTPGNTDATAGRKPAAKQPLPDTGSDVALVGVAVLVLAAVAGIVLAVRRRG